MANTLPFNPQLPDVPQGVYTDATYAANEAALRASIINQYHDVLQQIGYTNDQGSYIPGLLDVEANRQRGELGQQMEQAATGVTQGSQREGTLFSGIRANNTALAQQPARTGLAQLEENLPRQFATQYEKAGGLVNDYTLQRNQELANAAQRYTPPGASAPTPMAEGGLVDQPTNALVGEAGPEAVVPLQDGLRNAIAHLQQMYQAKQMGQGMMDQGLNTNIQQQLSPSHDQGLNRGHPQGTKKPPRRPNIKAAGLKAAASILSEAAKEHELEGQQGQQPLGPPIHQGPQPLGPPIHPGPVHPAILDRFAAAFPHTLVGR